MFRVRLLVVLTVLFGFLLSGSMAEAAKGKKKKKAAAGEITAVEADKEKGSEGILTVKIGGGKKNPSATPTETKFKVTSATTLVMVSGKKSDRKESPATFADLKAGRKVRIVAGSDDKASKVMIRSGKKDKKKKNK